MDVKSSRSEIKWVLVWAIVIVLASSLPYVAGLAGTPPGYQFLGLTHNIDDGAVYLSWMRQASDGHLFISNLFTNQPQASRQINLLFLMMGWAARLTHLPLILVYHLFRMVLGVGLIAAVYKFSGLFLETTQQLKALIPIVGLSAGIGWLFPNAQAMAGPVDTWQPEAITFLSIYLNPLFLAGLLLMLGSLYFLAMAQRTGRTAYGVYAGLLLLLLGNIHTYDVITVGCVWASYIVALWVVERRCPTSAILLSALAALIAVPSAAYQFHLYRIDEVFQARANTPTPSPVIWSYLAGYGLVAVGAAIGGVLSVIEHHRLRSPAAKDRSPGTLLLLVWSVVGFGLPYIPVGQQRKLIMGLHVPLCILCAYGLTHLLSRVPGSSRRIVLICFVALSAVSNVKFMVDDTNGVLTGNTAPGYPPYISRSELAGMDYLSRTASPGDSIFAPPGFALFTPALTGRRVYYGHWSETPAYGEAIARWGALGDPNLAHNAWYSLIYDSHSRYYISEDKRWNPPAGATGVYMEECFRADNVRIYRYCELEARKQQLY